MSSGRQVLAPRPAHSRHPVLAAAVVTTTTTYYTAADPILGLPTWETAADTSRARLCGLHETSGWAAVAEQRELWESQGGHAACPIPRSCSGTTPRRGRVSPLSTLSPEYSTPPPTSTEKDPASWTLSPEGQGGARAGLLISCPFPVTTHQPFLVPSLCFLNTLNSEPEHLSLKPRHGGSRETLRDLQSEGASSEEGHISRAIRKLLGVICSQLVGGETKPAEQTRVREDRAGRGAEQGCFGRVKFTGKTPNTHTHTHA